MLLNVNIKNILMLENNRVYLIIMNPVPVLILPLVVGTQKKVGMCNVCRDSMLHTIVIKAVKIKFWTQNSSSTICGKQFYIGKNILVFHDTVDFISLL